MLTQLHIRPLQAGDYLERKNTLKLSLDKLRGRRNEQKINTMAQSTGNLSLAGSSAELCYTFEPGQMQQIPELNLDNGKWDLEVSLEADASSKYTAVVKTDLFKKSSKLLQFSTGTIITLKNRELASSSRNFADSGTILSNEQETINIVLEKVKGTGCLKDTEYNNFSLRRKIYHHKVCKVF